MEAKGAKTTKFSPSPMPVLQGCRTWDWVSCWRAGKSSGWLPPTWGRIPSLSASTCAVFWRWNSRRRAPWPRNSGQSTHAQQNVRVCGRRFLARYWQQGAAASYTYFLWFLENLFTPLYVVFKKITLKVIWCRFFSFWERERNKSKFQKIIKMPWPRISGQSPRMLSKKLEFVAVISELGTSSRTYFLCKNYLLFVCILYCNADTMKFFEGVLFLFFLFESGKTTQRVW